MAEESSRSAPQLALPWIVRLRYAMVAGQILTCLFVDQLLGIRLPLPLLTMTAGLVLVSNLWLAQRIDRRHYASLDSVAIGWLFVLDTLCLTASLLLAGGPNNPFSLLYLVHITLSAAILTERQTWALGGLASLCFGLLFWNPLPLPAMEMHPHGGTANMHLVGMWVAFTVAAALVAIFSGRISALLRAHEQSLRQAQEELARKERLASLVTLAAGAAHELSTPLGTIAIVAKELENYAANTQRDQAVVDDSRLIRQEVDRCSGILRRMSLAGAEPMGEAFEEVSVACLLAWAEAQFETGVLVDAAEEVSAIRLRIPRHAVEQALLALIKNGLDASASGAIVKLTASAEGTDSCVRFAVCDEGCGMSEEALRRAGDPFFSTKDPGSGMGLGIFLVRTLAEQLHGQLHLTSQLGSGTRAVLEIPCLSVCPHPVVKGSR